MKSLFLPTNVTYKVEVAEKKQQWWDGGEEEVKAKGEMWAWGEPGQGEEENGLFCIPGVRDFPASSSVCVGSL